MMWLVEFLLTIVLQKRLENISTENRVLLSIKWWRAEERQIKYPAKI